MTPMNLVKAIVKTLDEKKAMELTVLQVGDLTIVADYFVMATGTSSTHVKSLANDVEFALSGLGVEPSHVEGKATGWILLDYGSVVVHVFLKESRAYYNLEHLWTDAKELELSEIIDGQEHAQ